MSSNTSVAIVGILVAALSPIVTLAIKGFIDSRLESKKALLTKDSKLFERRLDAIVALYGLLRDTEACYGCLTDRFIRAGEPQKRR